MARTPTVNRDQEAVIRQFIEGAELTKIQLTPTFYVSLMTMLGYKIAPNGARVHADAELKIRYGQPVDDAFEDTYYADWAEMTANEVADNSNTPDSGTSKSA